MKGSPARIIITGILDEFLKGIHFCIEIINMMDDQCLQSLWAFR